MQQLSFLRVEQIIRNVQGKKILVLGDVMIDRYLRGRVSRLSPEAPVPVVDMESETSHFGGAANVALNLKTLGCDPLMVGLVGHDEYGRRFISLLEESGMSGDGVIAVEDRPTTVKTRIIGDNQHIARVDRELVRYVAGTTEEHILEHIGRLLPQAEAVILEDYNKGMLSPAIIEYTIAEARRRNIIVTVDPKFTNFLAYKQATLFKPNLKESAQALARSIETTQEVEEAARQLQQTLDVRAVLLTRGADGMTLYRDSDEIWHIPTQTREVADVSGAGDTVIATLTAALCAGADEPEAALIANYAAGIVCEEVGIVPVEKDRLLHTISGDLSR